MPATEDPHSNLGVGPHIGPPVGQWAAGYPAAPVHPSRMWPAVALGAIVLALIATIVAVVALVVATSRSSSPAADVDRAHLQCC